MDSRLPITPTVLLKIVSAQTLVTESEFNRLLFHAMFVLAFHAFLRVGEITKTAGSTQHYLLAKHLTFNSSASENLVRLKIPNSKHSKQIATLIIRPNLLKPLVCPYLACKNYLDARKHLSLCDPLFSFMDGSPVSRKFSTQLKLCLSTCKLNEHFYHKHRFRIGATYGKVEFLCIKKYIGIPTLHIW